MYFVKMLNIFYTMVVTGGHEGVGRRCKKSILWGGGGGVVSWGIRFGKGGRIWTQYKVRRWIKKEHQ